MKTKMVKFSDIMKNSKHSLSVKDYIKDDYYCESCMREDLASYVIDDIGSIFCSKDCFEQFHATDIENKGYHKRHVLVEVVEGD